MNQSSKWLTEDATESSSGGTGLELTFRGKFVCRGFHGLLQWPETTCFHAAPTATLHTPHLQRSASTGETCTIFNWPSKHTGQQGSSPFVILILYFCAIILFNVPLVFFSFLILLPTLFLTCLRYFLIIKLMPMYWSPIGPNCFVGLMKGRNVQARHFHSWVRIS